jgi:hypothetical protein
MLSSECWLNLVERPLNIGRSLLSRAPDSTNQRICSICSWRHSLLTVATGLAERALSQRLTSKSVYKEPSTRVFWSRRQRACPRSRFGTIAHPCQSRTLLGQQFGQERLQGKYNVLLRSPVTWRQFTARGMPNSAAHTMASSGEISSERPTERSPKPVN